MDFLPYFKACFVALFFGICLHAQDGPGGVGSADGSSELELWLDASSVDDYYDQNVIDFWEDRSGNANDADFLSGAPSIHFGSPNNQAYLYFDASFLEGQMAGGLSAPATITTVVYFENLNQGAAENDYVISVGSSGSTNAHTSISRRNTGGSNSDEYYSFDNTAARFGPSLTGQSWMIITQVLNSSAPFHELYVSGASQTVADFTSAISTDGSYRIGQYYFNGDNELDGRVAEVIAYSDALNSAKLKLLHSALSAKYEIAISNDVYSGDLASNGDFDLFVAGIGVESDGGNDTAESEGMTLIATSGFGTGDYAVLGSRGLTNGVNVTDIASGGAGIEARWDRQWFLDATDGGTAAEIQVRVNFNDARMGGLATGTVSNYKLLYRSDSTSNWSVLSSASSAPIGSLVFSSVSLPGDGYLTLGTIDSSASELGATSIESDFNGPGGIGGVSGNTSLKLWTDITRIFGETDQNIITLKDFSGNDHDVSQSVGDAADLMADSLNGQNFARFDGIGDYYPGTLNYTPTAPQTMVAVALFDQTNQGVADNDYIVSIGGTGSAGDHASLARRQDASGDINKFYSWDGANARLSTSVITGDQWNIHTQVLDDGGGTRHYYYRDGANLSVGDYSSASFSASSTDFNIGRWTAGSHYIDGDIAEVIVFDSALNSAQLNILHSYLSAKYDLPVSGDQYVGDDTLQGNYDLEVAGIGTEADGSHTIAQSNGLRMESVSGLETGDYILFGHAKTSNDVNRNDIAEGTSSIVGRWDRVWYVDITNTTAGDPEVNIVFDYSDGGIVGFPLASDLDGYKLLYRSGQLGAWTVVTAASSVEGDQVMFDNITLDTDGYYTIGSLSSVNNPLPLINMGLQAEQTDVAQEVKLSWWKPPYRGDYYIVETASTQNSFEEVATLDCNAHEEHPEMTFPDERQGDVYFRVVFVRQSGVIDTSEVAHLFLSNEVGEPYWMQQDYEGVRLNSRSEQIETVRCYSMTGSLLMERSSSAGTVFIRKHEMRESVVLLEITTVEGHRYAEKVLTVF